MNAQIRAALSAAAAAALLAACAGKPAPAPRAAPPVATPPVVVVDQPPSAPAVEDWPDRPLTPGDWSYSSRAGGSEARFAAAGGAGFSLSCDSGKRQVEVARQGASGPVRVRTTYGVRTLSPGAALAAADSLLDEIAFSRGRFAVEAEGAEALVIPAWPEAGRVVEDCRG
jgi:hypothetical protein